jgi:uncharacterized iron-regulated protein
MKKIIKHLNFSLNGRVVYGLFLGFISAGMVSGCAVTSKQLVIQDSTSAYGAGTIVSAGTALPTPFETLIDDLKGVRVIYVGENHTDPSHHQIQLNIIRALHEARPDVAVGMEMFDRSYQPILDRWSDGLMDQDEFIKKTHWYRNWGYPYQLYAEILDFIKNKKIRLVALNLPFHIPAKIRIGGIDSLMECDAAYLPKEIDTNHPAHRAYLEDVFKQHHGNIRDNFEYFYQAQCVWEDVMAESVAEHLEGDRMVVLAGNGHIIRKFGVPNRAFKRSGAPFRTIYLAPAGSTVTRDVADYIWVTP